MKRWSYQNLNISNNIQFRISVGFFASLRCCKLNWQLIGVCLLSFIIAWKLFFRRFYHYVKNMKNTFSLFSLQNYFSALICINPVGSKVILEPHPKAKIPPATWLNKFVRTCGSKFLNLWEVTMSRCHACLKLLPLVHNNMSEKIAQSLWWAWILTLSNTPDNLFQVLWPLYIEQITKIFIGVKKCLHEGGDDLVSHEQVGSHPSKEGEGSRRLHKIQISSCGLVKHKTDVYCVPAHIVFQYNSSSEKLCSVWWPQMRTILCDEILIVEF